jgi:Pro-kumamolisin, activation domain
MTTTRLLAIAAALAIAVPAAASAARPTTGWRAPTADRARDLGPVRPGLTVTVSLGLRHDRAGLRAHLARVSRPGSRVTRLSRDQLARRFGARPEAVASVRRWAGAHGLRATVNRGRTRVVLRGSARGVQRAVSTPGCTAIAASTARPSWPPRSPPPSPRPSRR